MKNFIRRIDQDWLLNHPTLWATRLHYFLYAYVFILAATYLVGITLPMSLANVPSTESYFMFSLVLSSIAYIIWAYKASLFQVTKQFGNTTVMDALKTQAIYLTITCMLGAVPFLFTTILAQREARLVSEKELSYDCNVLNLGMYYLEASRMKADYSAKVADEAYQSESEPAAIPPNTNYTIDPLNYYKEFSLYGGIPEWNESEIIDHIGKNKAERLSQIEAFIQTARKYGGEVTGTASEILTYFETGQYNYYFNDSYEVSNTLREISKAKTGKLFFQLEEFRWGSLFVAFSTVFTLFTFIATSLRTFVLSIFTFLIGAMFLGLLWSFTDYLLGISGSDEESILGFGYIVLVGFLALFGIKGGTQPRIIVAREIALSLATVLTPFIPVAALVIFDVNMNKYHYETQEYLFYTLMYSLLTFSAVGSWFVWNILYRPQLKKLQTIPVRN